MILSSDDYLVTVIQVKYQIVFYEIRMAMTSDDGISVPPIKLSNDV